MQSSLPVFYEGRGSDGRTPWLTVTDLSLIQDVNARPPHRISSSSTS